MGFAAIQTLVGVTKLSELAIDIDKNWLTYLIKNLGDPVDAQDAATRAYVLAQLASYLPLAGGTMAGDIAMSNNMVSGLKAPVDDNDAARKKYVDDTLGADFPMKLKPAVTRWVIPGWSSHGYSTGAVTAGRIYYVPIFVTETTTYIRIGIYVNTAVVGTCDLRIYNWSSGLPSSQVLSAGLVDHNILGSRELVIDQQLTRGYYFLAYRCTGAPALRSPGISRIGNTSVPGIADNCGSNGLPGCCMMVDAVFTDPAPAPTGLAWAYNAAVFLREN